jgi:hypothetical protein
LYQRTAENELNLFEFSSGSVAEACTAAEKIMRCEMIDADSLGISFDRVPDEVGGHSKIQLGSALQIRLKIFSAITPESRSQISIKALHQSGTRAVPSRPPFPLHPT